MVLPVASESAMPGRFLKFAAHSGHRKSPDHNDLQTCRLVMTAYECM